MFVSNRRESIKAPTRRRERKSTKRVSAVFYVVDLFFETLLLLRPPLGYIIYYVLERTSGQLSRDYFKQTLCCDTCPHMG